ncbi:hypothetical protein MUCCIDRAFT_80770 [Mucor lusitanicus CBS 277.49]|uniref:Uncharacterized protein n=1 Tax=Mucor lusitanicus CBS 277.49 TaxID=747725 RepID=A0A168KTE2_MUCCL|nr:hypothetical protein MUCCIDRAFT_80770 [Mucor lusitanicus CBS 277.49]
MCSYSSIFDVPENMPCNKRIELTTFRMLVVRFIPLNYYLAFLKLSNTTLLEVQDSIFNASGKTDEQLGELRMRRDELTKELQAMLEVERLTAVVPGVPLPVKTSSGSNSYFANKRNLKKFAIKNI